MLAARAAHLRKPADFAIRVNPDVAANTHPYISTGLHEHKFGVPWRDAAELYRRGSRKKFLRARGVSVHIGSQITDVDAFGEAMQRVASLVRSLRADGTRHPLCRRRRRAWAFRTRQSGGRRFRLASPALRSALLEPLRQLDLHLLLEPGRSIIAPAGALITRVVYRKRNDGKQFVVVDAAMNDLIRPSLYDAYHEIVPVVLGNRRDEIETVDIVGPVCESGDFLARGREIPAWKKANCWRFWMPGPTACRWRRTTTLGRERPKCWSTASAHA